MSRPLRYSEDELREQWAFLDALVDRQASSLRSGVGDPEEESEPGPSHDALLREVSELRARVSVLEAERRDILERLRLAESAAEPPVAPRPVEPRSVESRLRDWWRRVSR